MVQKWEFWRQKGMLGLVKLNAWVVFQVNSMLVCVLKQDLFNELWGPPKTLYTFSLYGAKTSRPKESFGRDWGLWLGTLVNLAIAGVPWDVVWVLLSLLLNIMSDNSAPSTPLPLTLLAFTKLGPGVWRKVFWQYWVLWAGLCCQASTSLSPMGWNWSVFELATK